MLSNPKDQQKLKGMLNEISNSMTRMEAERDMIKEIIDDAAESFEIDKKYIRKIARIVHAATYSKVKTENEELETMYETLFAEEE